MFAMDGEMGTPLFVFRCVFFTSIIIVPILSFLANCSGRKDFLGCGESLCSID